MLYDQRWDAKTKADPLTVEPFVAWLETQPPKKEYNFCLPHKCLVAQYLQFVGAPRYVLSSQNIPEPIKCIVKPSSAEGYMRSTVSAALTRARAVLTERAGA